MLVQHEKLYSAVEDVYKNLSESSGGAISSLRLSLNASETAADIDSELEDVSSRLSDAFFEIEDISDSFRNYLLKDNYSPERLAECEERLSVIHRLSKKYGSSVVEILDFLKESEEKLERIENYEEDRSSLQKKASDLEQGILSEAEAVSSIRKENGQLLGGEDRKNTKETGYEGCCIQDQCRAEKETAQDSLSADHGEWIMLSL